MPIHEYQCEKCGYIFEEVTLKMSAVKISTSCPACKGRDDFGIAKRVISRPGKIQVNGFNAKNNYSGHMR